MVDSVKTLTRPEQRADVAAFFAEHPIPQAAKTLEQILERQGVNVALRERAEPALAKAFTDAPSLGPSSPPAWPACRHAVFAVEPVTAVQLDWRRCSSTGRPGSRAAHRAGRRGRRRSRWPPATGAAIFDGCAPTVVPP